jgi:phage gpG-like protein
MDIQEATRQLQQFRRDLPLLVGNEILNFALDNFEAQGFKDRSVKRWPDRKHDPDTGRAILVGKGSGRLRRSLRITRHAINYVEVGTSEKYAKPHNEGLAIKVSVTPRSRKFFWAMHYNYKDVDTQKAEMYKALALTKKTNLTIQMPERRFIGKSDELNKRILNLIEKRLKAILS